MSNIVQLGYAVNTKGLNKASDAVKALDGDVKSLQARLDKGVSSKSFKAVATAAKKSDKSILSMSKSINLLSSKKITLAVSATKANQAIESVSKKVRALKSVKLNVSASGLSKINNDLGKIPKTPFLGVTNSAKRATTATGGLFSKIGALRGLLIGGVFTVGISDAVQMIDAYKNVNSLLGIVTESQAEFNQVQGDLFKLSQQNFSTLDATTRQYSGQAKQLKDMGRSGADALKIVDLFGKSLATSGASTTEAASATLQWTQAISSGVLRGEEFNSIMENGRGVAIALSDGLNVNIGTLRAMAKEGKLTADVVVDALLSQEEAIRDRFSKIPITVGKAWTQLRNSATVALTKINEAVGDATGSIANLVSSTSRALDNLNFDKVIFGIKTAAGLITAVLIPSIVSAGKAALIAFATNPLGLLISGIVIASVKLAEFKDATISIGNSSATVADWIGASWDYVKEKVGEAYSFLKDIGTGLFESTGASWLTFVNTISDDSPWKTVAGYMGEIPRIFKETTNFMIGAWVGTINSIINGYELVPDALKDLSIQAINGMIGAFEGGVNSIILGFHNIPVNMINQVKDGIVKSAQIFDNLVKGLKSLPAAFGTIFKAAMNNAKKWVLAGVNNVIGWLNSILPESKQITKAVGDIGNTAIGSVQSIVASVKSGEKIQADDIFQVNFGRIENSYKGAAKNLGNVVNDEFSKALSVDYLGNALDGVTNNINASIASIGAKAESRQFLREFSKDIEEMGGNMQDSSIKAEDLGKTANASAGKIRELGKGTGETSKELKKLQEATESSDKALLNSFDKEIAGLDRRNLALTASNNELLKYDLAQQRFGKNQLKYSQAQIAEIANKTKNIVLLEDERKKRDAGVKVLTDAKTALSNYFEEQRTGITVVDGLTSAEQSQLQVIRDKTIAAKAYADTLKSQLERQSQLTQTPTQNFRQNLEAQGVGGGQLEQLVGLNSANDARESFGQVDQENLRFEEEMLRLEAAEQLKLDTILPFHELRETLEIEHEARLQGIRDEAIERSTEAQISAFRLQTDGAKSAVFGMLDVLKASGQEQGKLYKVMFAASKAFAIAESIIKIQQGIAQAASQPFPLNLSAIGSVLGATAGIVSTIKGTQYGGAFATGGEFIVGGSGGTDSQQVFLDATPGEKVIVQTPAQQKASDAAPVKVENVVNIINNSSGSRVEKVENEDGSINAFIVDIDTDGPAVRKLQETFGLRRTGSY